jgi:hypothetical protein
MRGGSDLACRTNGRNCLPRKRKSVGSAGNQYERVVFAVAPSDARPSIIGCVSPGIAGNRLLVSAQAISIQMSLALKVMAWEEQNEGCVCD